MLIFQYLVIAAWSFAGLVSINHIYSFCTVVFSTYFLGVFAWLVIFASILFLGRKYFRQIFLVFLAFFLFGYYKGPYLEPPADPLSHLQQSYSFLEKKSDQIIKGNRGLWHYSMSSVLMKRANVLQNPEKILRYIDLLHGLYCGLLMSGLFILAKSAGLPGKWAFLAILICYLFFGTNRFSYFSYYSFAPTFSSILICWLWTAAFFFKRGWKTILSGLVTGGISLPIIWVNHFQEAAFIGFIIILWLMINLHEKVWPLLRAKHSEARLRINLKLIYLFVLILILFILPQFQFIQNNMPSFFERDNWLANQEPLVLWHGFHIIGKVWSYRIFDTLGLVGILPAFLFLLLLFSPSGIERKNIRIMLLGVVPFIVYFTPLFNFIWASNSDISTYYRFCYCSMFWLSISFFLGELEAKDFLWQKFNGLSSRFFNWPLTSKTIKNAYFISCVTGVIILSLIRSAPIYGKLDFLSLDTRPWWKEWQPLIKETLQANRIPVYTDPQTSLILKSVFNYPVKINVDRRDYYLASSSVIDIKSMDRANESGPCLCFINLHGFTPSWVPAETHHWFSGVAETAAYYEYDGIKGEELKKILRTKPPKNCKVYF